MVRHGSIRRSRSTVQAGFVTLHGWTERTDVGDDAYVLLARVRFASTGDDQVPVVPEDGFLGPYDMAMVLQGRPDSLVDESTPVPALGDRRTRSFGRSCTTSDRSSRHRREQPDRFRRLFLLCAGVRQACRAILPTVHCLGGLRPFGPGRFRRSGVLRAQFRQDAGGGAIGRADRWSSRPTSRTPGEPVRARVRGKCSCGRRRRSVGRRASIGGVRQFPTCHSATVAVGVGGRRSSRGNAGRTVPMTCPGGLHAGREAKPASPCARNRL
jgi:hypothetical protein